MQIQARCTSFPGLADVRVGGAHADGENVNGRTPPRILRKFLLRRSILLLLLQGSRRRRIRTAGDMSSLALALALHGSK